VSKITLCGILEKQNPQKKIKKIAFTLFQHFNEICMGAF
jgi:hypothetical protein